MANKKLNKWQRYYRKNKAKYKAISKKRRDKEKEGKPVLTAEEKVKIMLAKRKVKAKDKMRKKYNKIKNIDAKKRQKRASYFVATTRGGKIYKILKRYLGYERGSDRWDKALEEQKNLFYKGRKYPLFFLYKLKENEKGGENVVVTRSSIGKNVETSVKGYKIIFHNIWYNEKKVMFKNKEKLIFAHNIMDFLNFNDNIKQVFTINNKICIDDDGNYFLFGCGSMKDAVGIKNRLQEKMMEIGKGNVLFFNDVRSIYLKDEIYEKICLQLNIPLSYLSGKKKDDLGSVNEIF